MLKSHPHLRSCLKRCIHCQILFLTDPRNRGRNDLGCPFGCRQAHRKAGSNERSTRYYQTDEGKLKKKQLNDRRGHRAGTKKEHAGADAHEIDPAMLCHIQMVVSLIERRTVARIEIVELLRQHSMDFDKKPMYKCAYLKKQPP